MARKGHKVEVYAFPFGPDRTISIAKVESFMPSVPYHETSKIHVDADIVYVNYAPFVWRRMRLNGKRIAGLHTHLVLPNQHIKQTVTHPIQAGYDWYVKTLSFAALLPLLKVDLASFDAVHIPLGRFTLHDKDRLYKIPLWVDLEKIPNYAHSKFEKFTVLFAGRKTWEKGWFTFREIAHDIKRKGYDFNFACTGNGTEDIEGLGFVSDDRLFEIYQRSHLVVYPSIADVFGLVILEATACGVPVVTTPIDVHVSQGLPILYAETAVGFERAILHAHFLWKEQPEKYFAWCQSLRNSAEKYDVKRVFPLFQKMIEDVSHNTELTP